VSRQINSDNVKSNKDCPSRSLKLWQDLLLFHALKKVEKLEFLPDCTQLTPLALVALYFEFNYKVGIPHKLKDS
jgi:hypothetical protein